MLDEIRRVISRIPKGKVATYGQIADIAGFPGASRQVAWALHNNSRGIPWHRVLGAGGRIRLPGESGLEQRLRLRTEKVAFIGDRVDLSKHGWQILSKKAPAATGSAKSKPTNETTASTRKRTSNK